jgi:hypothetical protein
VTADSCAADLDWLEEEFREYNEVNGYPAHLTRGAANADPIPARYPVLDHTRRFAAEKLLAETRAALTRAEQELLTMRGSRSWTATAPLRWLGQVARSVKVRR